MYLMAVSRSGGGDSATYIKPLRFSTSARLVLMNKVHCFYSPPLKEATEASEEG